MAVHEKPIWCFLVVLFSFVLLSGCVTRKAVTKAELAALPFLTVIRHATEPMHETTVGKQLGGFLLLGGVGAAIAIEAGKKDPPLDFGQLVTQTFAERVVHHIPEWPRMTVKDRPVEQGYVQPGTALVVRTSNITLHDVMGFAVITWVEMTRGDGESIWRNRFLYKSSDYNRTRSLEEFKADGNKLLNEEMRFAAQVTADVFIEELRASK